ncbi:MAG: hypothetical protein AAFP19_00140 [Bacteroidota bacterium]
MSGILRALGLALFLLLLACSSAQKKEALSAEQTARDWQRYVDQNEFDKAKAISTKQTLAMIEMIESIVSEDMEAEAMPPTVFLEMNCKEEEEKAICTYLMEGEGDQIRDSFTLIKVDGTWLVDIPEEDMQMDEEEMQQMFEDFEQIFEDALEMDSLESEVEVAPEQ